MKYTPYKGKRHPWRVVIVPILVIALVLAVAIITRRA